MGVTEIGCLGRPEISEYSFKVYSQILFWGDLPNIMMFSNSCKKYYHKLPVKGETTLILSLREYDTENHTAKTYRLSQ